MNSKYSDLWAKALFAATLVSLAVYTVLLQLTPALLTVDAYYHAAVTGFIKDNGWFLHDFHWTQMSVMKNSYSDKDLLLHVLALPFTFLTSDPRWVAKAGSMLLGFSFLGVMAILFRRYLPPLLAVPALLSPFLSPVFTIYFSDFRPGTLAAIFTLLGVFFAADKKKWLLFTVGVLYSLAHLSSFTLVFFAVLAELVRYARDREFCRQTIGYAAAGVVAGLIVHPNFPANLLTIYINGFLTPVYALGGSNIGFAMELYSDSAKNSLLGNLPVFAVFGGMLWAALVYRPRVSFHTMVYAASANVYFLLAMLSNRFWFPAVPLAVLAAASFLKDLLESEPQRSSMLARVLFASWFVMALPLCLHNAKSLDARIIYKNKFSLAYEKAAEWMRGNVPPGETVYHSSWGDSPYLICLNPRNNYLVVLDPIYMYYWSADVYGLYQDLYEGRPTMDPYKALKEVFKTTYGLSSTKCGFYQLIKNDDRFHVLYNEKDIVVFKLEDPPAVNSKPPAKAIKNRR